MKRAEFIKTMVLSTGVVISGITFTETPVYVSRFSTKQIDWLRIICNHLPFKLFITDDKIVVAITKNRLEWDEQRLTSRIEPLDLTDEDTSIAKYVDGSKYFWLIVEFKSKQEKDDVINRICYNIPGGIKVNTTLPPPYWMPRLDTADGYRYNNGAHNITKHLGDWSDMEAVAADITNGIYL